MYLTGSFRISSLKYLSRVNGYQDIIYLLYYLFYYLLSILNVMELYETEIVPFYRGLYGNWIICESIPVRSILLLYHNRK